MSALETQRAHPLSNLFAREFSSCPEKMEIRLLLFAHRQADPDALCAASGLSLILRKLFSDLKLNTTIVAPQGASALGKRVCSNLGIQFQESIDDESIKLADFIVALDTGDQTLLEPYLDQIFKSNARKFLIDHHTTSVSGEGWPHFDEMVVESKATSACEVVTLGFAKDALGKKSARILLTGLMFDSQHLGLATVSTLEAALLLVKSGAEIEEAKTALRYKPDRSEVLARIKSAQRLRYLESGKYLILSTEVSSFQASVARMLVEIGGNVGIASGENDGEMRLSVRCSQSFFKETGIDLAREVHELSVSDVLVGGGHSTAASLSGKGDHNKIAIKLIERIKAKLPQT